MHPGWLSNAFVAAAGPGEEAFFVDSGAPLEPLVAAVDRERLRPTHLLTTHTHPDHTAGDEELRHLFGVIQTNGPVEIGGLAVQALPTPGHAPDHVSFYVPGEAVFAGDILAKDSVGGGSDVVTIRASVMDVLMQLPHDTTVYPGHEVETTIGREWEENPFVRYWRGITEPLDEPVKFGVERATLLVWGPDYDGKGKALVRFEDGREAIVGGSRVTR
jgi:glyoxylase-like metal-dependent hydrolase (beta-lactamase superfamily II)